MLKVMVTLLQLIGFNVENSTNAIQILNLQFRINSLISLKGALWSALIISESKVISAEIIWDINPGGNHTFKFYNKNFQNFAA